MDSIGQGIYVEFNVIMLSNSIGQGIPNSESESDVITLFFQCLVNTCHAAPLGREDRIGCGIRHFLLESNNVTIIIIIVWLVLGMCSLRPGE